MPSLVFNFLLFLPRRGVLALLLMLHLIDVVMDRFGEKTICHKNSDNTFYINEEVQVAPTFWGWLFQFGSQAKVLGPERAVEMAKDAISDIADCYK